MTDTGKSTAADTRLRYPKQEAALFHWRKKAGKRTDSTPGSCPFAAPTVNKTKVLELRSSVALS